MDTQLKKESLQSIENSIKKSNEISMAELNYGLDLNQIQLLAFAIYSTQQDGKTEFRKHEFQDYFNIERYNTKDAYKDSKRISNMQVSVKDLEQDYFRFTNVFMDMVYNKGEFTFEWNPKMTPHILEIKERYVVTDLKVASHFKSSFSWRLYEYLKAHYGYFRKILTKEEALQLFNVQNKNAYKQRVNNFKKRVLDVAIEEINKYTELEVWYKEQKDGRSIIGFEVYWSKGQVTQKATQKQIDYIQSVIGHVMNNMFTYMNLDNENNRERAFEFIEKIKEYRTFINDPVNINIDKANEVIQELEFYVKLLNDLVGKDKPKRDTSFYYNWLSDEEEE